MPRLTAQERSLSVGWVALLAVLVASCSNSPGLDEVMIDSPSEGWTLFLDQAVDSELISFIDAFADNNPSARSDELDGVWMRVWERGDAMTMAVLVRLMAPPVNPPVWARARKLATGRIPAFEKGRFAPVGTSGSDCKKYYRQN